MQRSKIEWTHFTSNPLKYRTVDGKVAWGCIHKSGGCEHCYAEALAKRYGRGLPFTAQNMKGLTPFLDDKELHYMLTYKPASGKMCFVGDMTDIFGEWVPFELLDKLFAVFALRPDVTFQVLTKRPERMREYFCDGPSVHRIHDAILNVFRERLGKRWSSTVWLDPLNAWPLPNVWLGVSVEDQKTADARIPAAIIPLLEAGWRCMLSCEPLFGPIIFKDVPGFNRIGLASAIQSRLHVIVGGESGPGARPCHVQWIRDVIAECRAANVAAFVKQLGAVPMEHPSRIREWPAESQRRFKCLDAVNPLVKMLLKYRKGGDINEFPEDLRIREFPQGVLNGQVR